MRLQQLDSLRGLAACSVVLCHATNVLPAVYDDPRRLWWLTETPLALLRAGHAAVVFFFVLSGYVLVLPFLKGPVSYPSFVVRRLCRIWIPYVTAMIAAVGCAMWFHPSPVSGLSHWANRPIGVHLAPQMEIPSMLVHHPSLKWRPVLCGNHVLTEGTSSGMVRTGTVTIYQVNLVEQGRV